MDGGADEKGLTGSSWQKRTTVATTKYETLNRTWMKENNDGVAQLTKLGQRIIDAACDWHRDSPRSQYGVGDCCSGVPLDAIYAAMPDKTEHQIRRSDPCSAQRLPHVA